MSIRFFFLCLISLSLVGCVARDGDAGSLTTSQRELVLQVKGALGQLPDEPHKRTRNRELGLLAEVALEADEESLVLEVVEAIDNWRNIQLKAELATTCYNMGREEKARQLVEEVEQTVDTVLGIKSGRIVAAGENKNILEEYDDFRLDRVKVALSKYYFTKGDKESAKKWSEGVLPAEQSEFIKQQAQALAKENYDTSLAVNNILIKGETFEGKKAGIDGLVLLFDLYYGEEGKRNELKALIDEFSISMPVMYRVEWLHGMALSAFGHGDAAVARSLYIESSLLISEGSFKPRLFFPLKAENIITSHKLGFREEASEAADLLYGEYARFEGNIYNIHRADVLCAVGEMFVAIGRMDRAEEVYLNALDQAGVNPNSRPRVEDLNLIACSLIKHDVPLTSGLHEKMDGFVGSLGAPW
ncbi:hypothetical protein PDESU_00224 [Pontiella desulfatans]|uniref:MalT-like TPR region domain-containing protein n=1 Tax=Pontiella desulfatans TaxID=2750659 RepID=A0A6C2TVP1_PONDE|nr:hypothetical protein [Pontiella desulfatans]VGO11679.1 hypothetical protein PDESU_00224 [Pontiella desulfatans]